MRILKSYGTLGGVIVSTAYAPEDIKTSEPVFIYFDELPVPFFIEEFKPKGTSKAFLKLEDIDSLEAADEIVGKDLIFGNENSDDDEKLSGQEIYDYVTKELVGTVIDYIDIPSNPCLDVLLPNNETILIPFHEDLIKKIDNKKGHIYIEIPKGLV